MNSPLRNMLFFVAGLLMILSAGFSNQLSAQILPDDICRIENNQLVFRINTGWNEQEFQELIRQFSLDSTFVQFIEKGLPSQKADSLGWEIRFLAGGWIEIAQPLNESDVNMIDVFSDFFLLDQNFMMAEPLDQGVVRYGVNDFKNAQLFKQDGETACLCLEGFESARDVYLAGSFNSWSVNELPMKKTQRGWEACISLQPGKHLYKFIVDGRWMTDPNNGKKEGDSEFNQNSVLFQTNHTFTLKGYPKARKVILAGSFNDFDRNELRMKHIEEPEQWELDIYLREGTHYYKFVVNNNWILDPDNPDVRTDNRGNENSVLGIGEPHAFFLEGYTSANEVKLTGSFNDWNTDEIFMQKGTLGWTTAVILGPGIHTYKYIIDGQWTPDPNNPYTTGTGVFVNSVLILDPNHIFRLEGFENAETVAVSGSFNNWSNDGYRMIRENGAWIFPVRLNPGKHTYKFIVDGAWILDPDNEFWEENQYGTDNSVLWIENK